MQRLKIQYKGIARAGADQEIQDGYLLEGINLKERKQKVLPRGSETKTYNLPTNGTDYTGIWFHDQDHLQNFIGYKQATGELILLDPATDIATVIDTLTAGEAVQVVFLKYYMIVVSDVDTRTYLWSNNAYTKVSRAELYQNSVVVGINSLLGIVGDKTYNPEQAVGAEAIKGKYFELVDQISKEDGKLTGALSYRVALRMYDGSYVFHSVPQIITLDINFEMEEWEADGGGQENDPRRINFNAYNLKADIDPALFQGLNAEIFTELCIFFSRNVEPYDWDTFTDDDLSYGENNHQTYPLTNIIDTVSKAYKELKDPESFYLVHEQPIKEIQEKAEVFSVDIDTKDFYQDYSVREPLPINSFSQSSITGKVAYAYNDRLILAATSSKLNPYDMMGTIKYQDYYFLFAATNIVTVNDVDHLINMSQYLKEDGSLIFVIDLKTASGDIRISYTKQNQPYYYLPNPVNSSAGQIPAGYYFLFPAILGYPDSRAYNMKVYHKTDLSNGRQTKLVDVKLTESEHFNYSYYIDEDYTNLRTEGFATTITRYRFDLLLAQYSDAYANAEYVALDQSGTIYDSNRVQISELKNPIYFPAANSYQVGTGEIMAVATNSEPLSQGQFGQFPLIVFTTKGIWTMAQGSGDVLFASIQPVNGEVANNKDQILGITSGVTYSTDEGLFLISGRTVQELTKMLVGPHNAELQANEYLQFFLNHQYLVQLVDSISTVDAEEYILGAKVGFCKKTNELLVTNSEYQYSYVLNLKSGNWLKISRSYDLIINKYPELLCLGSKYGLSGIYTFSEEDFTQNPHILVITRPLNLQAPDTFKILDRVFQRGQFKTSDNCRASLHVFISDDLQQWQFSQGNDQRTGTITDIMLTRSHTKAKYIVIMFSGQLQEDSVINALNVEYYLKLQSKLR